MLTLYEIKIDIESLSAKCLDALCRESRRRRLFYIVTVVNKKNRECSGSWLSKRKGFAVTCVSQSSSSCTKWF